MKVDIEKLMPTIEAFVNRMCEDGRCSPDLRCRSHNGDDEAYCDVCWRSYLRDCGELTQAIDLLREALDLAGEYPMSRDGQYYSLACDIAEFLGLPKPVIKDGEVQPYEP